MSGSLGWGKWLVIAALAFGAWQLVQRSRTPDLSTEELTQLASTVRPDDVLIYTTTDCQYCAQAKAWMTQYGFAFTECDAQVRADCARDLQALGSGVPYLVVRGHHMKNGFDSDEFIAALR